MIYLDHAATTPLDESVLQAMQPYLTTEFYNPSASYLPAKKVRAALEEARARTAHCLGARPSEIIFTAGGTESNNLAIQGVMRRFFGSAMVTSAVEHDSVRQTARQFQCAIASVDMQGRIDLADLESKITDETVLVSVMYANNEVGAIQPLTDIGRLVSDIRAQRKIAGNKRPLYFHTDACQAANYLDLQVHRLGVDMMTLNASKIYGPKQTGVLYVASGVELEPLIYGGGQERGIRSGTENVAGAVGFAVALDLAQSMRHSESKRLSQIQRQACNWLKTELPTATVNGSQKYRLPNNIHLTLPGTDNERLIFALETKGFLVAAGSACSASSSEPSHVLKAMGMSGTDAQASLRVTMGRSTNSDEITNFLLALKSLVE